MKDYLTIALVLLAGTLLSCLPLTGQFVINPYAFAATGGAAIQAPTLLNAATNTTGTQEFITSGSVSPTASALLVVSWLDVIGPDTDDALATSITDTLTGTGTWTISEQFRQFGNASCVVGIGYAFAGSSPGSGTVTVNFTNAGTEKCIHVMEVVGANATPFGQDAGNGITASATLTVTLGATPAASSLVIAAIAYQGLSVASPGTGFTELGDTSITTFSHQSQYDLTSADTTADWSGMSAAADQERAGVAIEILD